MGDIGILRGISGATVERLYWKNKNTFQTADAPTEAKFNPNAWGLLRFRAAGVVDAYREPAMAGIPSMTLAPGPGGTLLVNTGSTADAVLTLTSLSGAVVLRQSLTPGTTRLAVARSAGNGVYICRIGNKSGTAIERVFALMH
jgi:hypothetical protein